MRSSKSRSRGNKNRNIRPTGGNIINRVFDSSGPEGKVRGTPAQIIEKYTQLHRDAQLAGDRVNAENFAQHAEHYTRLLAEAQRDIDKAREEQEQFNRDRQAERDRQIERDRERQAERQQNGNGDRQNAQNEQRHQDRERESQQRLRAQEEASTDPAMMEQPEMPAFLTRGMDQPVIDVADADPSDSGLVETPEARPVQPQAARPPRVDRRPQRQQRAEREPAGEPVAEAAAEPAPETTAEAAAEKPKAPRVRKPRPKPEAPAEAETGPAEAAE